MNSAIEEAQQLSDKLGFALMSMGKVPATDYFLGFFSNFLVANGFSSVEIELDPTTNFPKVIDAKF